MAAFWTVSKGEPMRIKYTAISKLNGCAQCGDADPVTRTDEQGNESEPLCDRCWYFRDHSADERYAALQAAYYDDPDFVEACMEYGEAVDRQYSEWKEQR